jgi:hypothetical protein
MLALRHFFCSFQVNDFFSAGFFFLGICSAMSMPRAQVTSHSVALRVVRAWYGSPAETVQVLVIVGMAAGKSCFKGSAMSSFLVLCCLLVSDVQSFHFLPMLPPQSMILRSRYDLAILSFTLIY